MYDKSAEEQRYLSSLQQEKTSFERLFKEETSLMFHKNDGDGGDDDLEEKTDEKL